MKKKLLLMLSLAIVMICVFAISVSAEAFNVTYFNGGTQKETVATNENGEITLREEGYSANTDTKSLLGWFTYEGDMYKPGETITVGKDTQLYQFYGFKVTQKNFVTTEGQWGWTYAQLQEDIIIENSIPINDGGRLYLDLNGHTITSTANDAFSQQRAGLIIVGEGKIEHSGSGALYRSSYHFFSPNNVCLYVGKNVDVTTAGTLYSWNSIQNHLSVVVPFEIYGTVTCKQLLHIDSSIDDYMGIVLSPEKLTVTGDKLFNLGTYPETPYLGVQVLGGTFDLPEAANNSSFWNSDNPGSYNFVVSKGAFLNGGSVVEAYLLDENKVASVEVGGVAYTVVIPNSECNHAYELTNEVVASCKQMSSVTYLCNSCGDSYTICYGDYAEHNWKLTDEKEASLTEAGYKAYKCDLCGKEKTEKVFLDVADAEIKVTVNTVDGEKEILVKTGDVFALEKISEGQYKLVGLKDFGEYTAADIVTINVPLGVVRIEFTSNNSTLKKLIINDGAVVTVSSFAKCSALTHIEIQKAEVVFSKGCSNNVIQSVKSEVEGADVNFEAQVFDGKSSLNELKLSSYSIYVFGANSFRNTSITEFVAPDYSDITFKNEAAFYKCNSLKYIYIGRGIEVLAGKPFDYCQYVEKVVLMDVKSISMEWTFCVQNMAEKPVEYYIHSSSISLPSNTFGQSKGLIIYSNAPITNGNAFSSCSGKTYNGVDYPAYTIIYGIPHAYTQTTVEGSCTENGFVGYVTDCPCGQTISTEQDTVTYKKFAAKTTNNDSFEEITLSASSTPAKGHTASSTVVSIAYKNGYDKLGYTSYLCQNCDVSVTEEEASAKALFAFKGYSVPEDGRLEISVGFEVNKEALATYEALTGKTLEYGLVAAIADKLDGKAPLDKDINAPVIKAPIDKAYSSFDMVLKGFNDEQKDLGVVMSAYVSEGDATVYIQNAQVEIPVAVSINQCIADNTPNEAPQE